LIGFVSAYFGYQTKERAVVLQDTLKTTKQNLTQTTTKLKNTEKDLSETKNTLEETKGTLKQTQDDLTSTKGQLDTAKSDLAKSQSDAEDKTKKLADTEGQLKAIQDQLQGFGGTADEIKNKIKDLQDTKAKLETELAESKQVQSTFQAKNAEQEATIANKETVIKGYKDNSVRQGLTGKVVAYNPGWNFVVLNIGDKAGLKPNVSMLVTRGGNMVGKLKVTSVEPNTAIADVLPGTIARGDSVQPGDSVVYEGSRR
jgi:hypothetical protein